MPAPGLYVLNPGIQMDSMVTQENNYNHQVYTNWSKRNVLARSSNQQGQQ